MFFYKTLWTGGILTKKMTKAVNAMETVFSSNIELLSEPKMVFKRKLIIHSFISERFREFKMRREY